MSENKNQLDAAGRPLWDAVEYCIFTVGGKEYGVDSSKVQKVCAEEDVALLPGVPGVVRGAISLHGIDVPVVDLRQLLNVDLNALDAFDALGNVVVLDLADNTMVGVIVDDVREKARVPPANAIPVMRVLQH